MKWMLNILPQILNLGIKKEDDIDVVRLTRQINGLNLFYAVIAFSVGVISFTIIAGPASSLFMGLVQALATCMYLLNIMLTARGKLKLTRHLTIIFFEWHLFLIAILLNGWQGPIVPVIILYPLLAALVEVSIFRHLFIGLLQGFILLVLYAVFPEAQQALVKFSNINPTVNLTLFVMGMVYFPVMGAFIIKIIVSENIRAKKLKLFLVQKDLYENIGKLSAGVTHEILNPLAGIKGPLEIVKDIIGKNNLKEDQETAHKALELIQENAGRIELIVKSLRVLIYHKPDIMETVQLSFLVESVYHIIDKQTKERIDFVVDVPEDLEIMVNVGSMNHILINLINNAIDAITGKGTISIKGQRADGAVLLIIKDTGKGIIPGDLGKIFDLNYTTKTIGNGTGLGLYLVKELAERNNIRIEVSSTVDQGTEFKLIK